MRKPVSSFRIRGTSALPGTCSISDSPRWRRPARASRSRRGCLTPKLRSLVSVTWHTSPKSRAGSMFRSMRTSRLAMESHRETWPIMSHAASRLVSRACRSRMQLVIQRRHFTSCRSPSSVCALRARRWMMDVYEAVTSRRSVRGFTDEPVSRELLERVLSAAAWSPSGSNIQPWNIYVMTGAPLAELKTLAVERVAHGDPWDERQYEMYPPALKSPYRERRSAFGRERYSALGIAREDLEARQRAAIGNWKCFGAPAALFCYIDRDLGRPQWADVGMYLQTVMLLLRAEGLHSCPQMAWSQVRETVAEVLSPPDGLILFCGMSIGYEDPTVSYARTGRAPLDETVTFVGG